MRSEVTSQNTFELRNIQAVDLIRYVSGYNHFCVLDSCTDLFADNNIISGRYDILVAAGISQFSIPKDVEEAALFAKESQKKRKWIFGHFSYNIKNKVEALSGKFENESGFPEWFFFNPEIVIAIQKDTLLIETYNSESAENIYQELLNIKHPAERGKQNFHFLPQTTKEQYLKNVSSLKEHIQYGNIYEVNYCLQFMSDQGKIDALKTYLEQRGHSPAPFSCFYRIDNSYLICSSPERFLCKRNDVVYAQPIKGTRKRSEVKLLDDALIKELQQDPKERAENVMIVDLTRNDLSKVALPDSVDVIELFGIYSFRHVHQMISTIKANIDPSMNNMEIILNAFPMGSMTGAPKVKAMQLIDEFEDFNRGMYSGSIGYISPDNDFDFNVVIRSLVYNETKKKVYLMVGSALTVNSNPEKEYQECILKASAWL